MGKIKRALRNRRSLCSSEASLMHDKIYQIHLWLQSFQPSAERFLTNNAAQPGGRFLPMA
jgi:hypothetical protein